MSNTEINRRIVQEGLNRRAAEAKRRESVLEDQARELRLIINDNHATKTAPRSPERQQEAIIREKKRMAHQEAVECSNWYRFLIRCFAPMLIGAVLVALSNLGAFPLMLAFPIAIVGCLSSVETFARRFIPIIKSV